MTANASPLQELSRRQAIFGTLAAAASASVLGRAATAEDAPKDGPAVTKGRINQTVCQWCYAKMKVEDLAANAAKMGLKGMDLVGPEHWPTLKKYNLVGTMTPSHPIVKGLNRKANWDFCLDKIRKGIEANAEAGFPNVICFSGNREGMSDEEGLANCADALKQVVGLAEEKKVTICMELLNSKVNHKDYMCDRSPWGVKLVKAVGSERFKLLYDIYHMQIMEGDVIATIKRDHDCFAHYHTGGVPGRNEIDETQELYYPAIMQAIVDTGYKGWVGQEFIPKRDPMASLAQAAKICDV
jgi:hydroxypyruvate isomerase